MKGVIIGAGIGGLTAAIALLKKGIDVEIYEQSAELNEVGAGIWVAPNGLKVFEQLGIADKIIEGGTSLNKIVVTDLKDRPVSVIDGSEISKRHNFTTVAIHRGTLQRILTSCIPQNRIILNKKFKSYSQSSNHVVVEFDDGEKLQADFLIAADGIKSSARLQMLSNPNLRYSGQTCWRFVTRYVLPEGEENNMYEIWSDRKGLRVGYSGISPNQVYVFVVNYAKAGGKDTPNTLRNELIELCREFPPVVKQLIASANAETIIRTDLFDFKPVTRWTDGRIALIGDAAHATTPNLGQGACQAIEDAYMIARQLSLNTNIAAAFKSFETKRMKKAAWITNTSWQFAQVTNTSGMIKSLLKGILRLTPASVQHRQLDKIYSIDY
ncbi:MAG: FAD-dependent monooxygenase [Cyclobacteriaceae bacterium]|nr:FAD-dependent monooxygenase [Cyclobacteriaceae bacterium]